MLFLVFRGNIFSALQSALFVGCPRFQAMVAAELLQKLGCDCCESEKTVLRSRFVLAVVASFSKRLSGNESRSYIHLN